MEGITNRFDKYQVWIDSGHPYEAHIYCYDGREVVGELIFLKDDADMPANSATNEKIRLHYPISRLSDVVDLLRYEKPLAIHLGLTYLAGYVCTTREPIGEEESETAM